MNNRLQSAHDVDFVCHEFVKGWDLNHWLINFGPIGEQLGSYFVKDLFSYVSYLHQNNISHNNFFNKSILICQNSF
jgi:serine/threonine protein kinase